MKIDNDLKKLADFQVPRVLEKIAFKKLSYLCFFFEEPLDIFLWRSESISGMTKST